MMEKEYDFTENKGIDYGLGLTNIDHKKGIRYGVINFYEVLQAWADESESVFELYCPNCNAFLKKGFDAKRCPSCYKKIDAEEDFQYGDPCIFFLKKDGYLAFQGYDDPDIFIEKSPYFTYAQFCSPCAPGAGYLMKPLKEKDPNHKTYCFGYY